MGDVDESQRKQSITAADVEAAAQRVVDSPQGSHWVRGGELDLGDKRWRPHAASPEGKRLLYVLLQDEIPRFARERLEAAFNCGFSATIALELASLYKPDVIKMLTSIDANVIVLDDHNKSRQLEPRELLTALADTEVPLPPDLRRQAAAKTLERIEDGTPQEKGKKLESLLAFLFSQVNDLKVVERNYRNETEEIDLVLQVTNPSSRCWQIPGCPFILVEAKNRVDKAEQHVVSTLITKLQTKRGTAKIALLISLRGFTEGARMQEMRFSTGDVCIVMIDRSQLETILNADDLDEELESAIRRAQLR